MTKSKKDSNIKEKLILSGIKEIEKNGVRNFSLRQVAQNCGVSCAAPFKHFSDKQDFLYEIKKYIDKEWEGRQEKVKQEYTDNVEKQLFEMILENIRFYVEYPHFIHVVLINDAIIGDHRSVLRHQLTDYSKGLIREYCKITNMNKITEKRKTFAIRSIIYGAALMFSNGEMEYNKENFDLITDEVRYVFKA